MTQVLNLSLKSNLHLEDFYTNASIFTGHFAFETFACIMAKSQIKFGLRDRQKFSRAKKALQTLIHTVVSKKKCPVD